MRKTKIVCPIGPYSSDVLFYFAQKTASDVLRLQPGDNIVITGGMVNGLSGNTNLIKVATVTS